MKQKKTAKPVRKITKRVRKISKSHDVEIKVDGGGMGCLLVFVIILVVIFKSC